MDDFIRVAQKDRLFSQLPLLDIRWETCDYRARRGVFLCEFKLKWLELAVALEIRLEVLQ